MPALLLLLLVSCAGAPPAPGVWYQDSDGDGYGDPAAAVWAALPVPGRVADGTDCDDGNAAVHPNADETCDGRDQDCDGVRDNDAIDATTWYPDTDNDGWGNDEDAVLDCIKPLGMLTIGGDCDDSDDRFYPGAVEDDCTDPNDYDCNGWTMYDDSDSDGWAACLDCDDTDGSVWPGAVERCNGVDDDCDGRIDPDDAADAVTWFSDADADGFGDPNQVSVACLAPANTVGDSSDCDDSDPTTWPGAVEVPCDGADNDCAGDGDIRCKPAGDADVGDAETIFYGIDVNDRAAYSAKMGGDTDGDGLPELLIGARGVDSSRGIMYLIEDIGLGAWTLDDVGIEIGGLDAKDGVGSDVRFVGDIMGSGYDGIGQDRGDAGDAIIFLMGPITADMDISSPTFTVSGTEAASSIGNGITSGDINGDGQPDLVYATVGNSKVADYGWLEYAGRAWAFYGPITADVETDHADVDLVNRGSYANFGYRICAADFTADGIDDLLIGAPCVLGCASTSKDGGAAFIFHGPISGQVEVVTTTGQLDGADARWMGGSNNDSYAGSELSCHGDVDGDGRADPVIGAQDSRGNTDNIGAAYLVDGALEVDSELTEATWAVEGVDPSNYVGVSVSSDSDLDNDGFDDIAVGWVHDSDQNGDVSLFYGGSLAGATSPYDGDARWTGSKRKDVAVYAHGGADLDRDGYDDLLIGAPSEDTNGDLAGAAYLIYGGGWVP